MTFAIEPGEIVECIHPDDMKQPEELRTIWRVKTPTLQTTRAYRNAATRMITKKGPRGGHETELLPDGGEMERVALKLHLARPERFLRRGPGGIPEEVEWQTERFKGQDDCPTDVTLGRIPKHVRGWLFGRIDEAGQIDEEDAGKP